MLDTSVWVALFEGEAIDAELQAAQGDLPTLSHPISLAELASLYARGRMGARVALEGVAAQSQTVPMTNDDAIAGGDLHGRLRRGGHPKVGLGDCLMYATAQRVGALLITADGDLAREPGVIVIGPAAQRKARRS